MELPPEDIFGALGTDTSGEKAQREISDTP